MAAANDLFVGGILWLYLSAWTVGIWITARRGASRRQAWFRAAAVTLSLVAGLVVLEAPAAYGALDYRRIAAALTPGSSPSLDFMEDPELSFRRPPRIHWTGQPETDMAEYLGLPLHADHPLRFTTDNRGFRNRTDRDRADIALIGDSFVEASAVSDDETSAVRLEQLTGSAVANLGISGYGTLQELIVLRKYALPLHPRVVAWFFFEGNDLDDDELFENEMLPPDDEPAAKTVSKPTPPLAQRWREAVDRSLTYNAYHRLRTMTDWLVPNATDSFGWFRDAGGVSHRYYFYDFYAARPLGDYERRRFETTKAAFRRGQDLAKRSGVRLIVFYIPIKFRVYRDFCTFPAGSRCLDWHPWDLEDHFAAFCHEAGIEYVSLTGPLRAAAGRGEMVYLPGDSHWSAAGQALAATVVSTVTRDAEHSLTPNETRR